MSNLYNLIVNRLSEVGFFNLLTFFLALTLIYALLRQKRILGDNAILNALIAFSVAFFIFAYPIITGVSLVVPLTTFFSQAFAVLLILFISFLIASLLYPNLPKTLEQVFTGGEALYVLIGVSVALFVSSGLVGVFYSYIVSSSQPTGPSAPPETILLVVGLIIVVVGLLLAERVAGGGK
jgi:hypothetical protein